MGVGNDEDAFVDDGEVRVCGRDGGGDSGGGLGKLFESVSCSICLDVVVDTGERSLAKLQCGHQFHLDCIGSAFNIKGVMQCPNCRKIEKGQWLYANGCRSHPEFNVDDWIHDDDLYDLSYSEMSFGVQWCPFGGLTRLPSTYDEGDFSSNTYHDILGQHAIFSESAALTSAGHPCPYIAYFGPVHPSSSNSSGSFSEASSFTNQWNGQSAPNEMPTSYVFPAVDVHYSSWEHNSSPFSTSSRSLGGTDQPSISPGTQRPGRASTEMPRSETFMHPLLVGHSSAARAGNSIASSMIPSYPGSNARALDRVQALQAYYQQQQPSNSTGMRTHLTPATRRSSSNHRGSSQVPAVASSSEQSSGFYFIPSGSSGRSFQEQENPVPSRFHGWERGQLPSLSVNQLDRNLGWGRYHHAGGSDAVMRSSSSFRLRHGSERMPSQYR